MANFSAALFCFFTLSLALAPLNTAENDAATTEVSLQIPDASNPSVPVNADDNPLSLSNAVPLTTISLSPFNRRFSNFPCHRRQFYKADPKRPLEIPYGNDMIVSSGENRDFQDTEAILSGSWQRVKLHHHHHHHHDEDSDSDDEYEDDRIKKMALKHLHFGGLDAEKKLKKLKKHFRHENTEEDHKKERDGFMIRARKSFYHYF